MAVLSNPTVVINNNPVPIIPNSFQFDEGQGEQTLRTESTGGGAITQQLADDITTHIGGFQFEMLNTEANIELAREFKLNGAANVVEVSQGNFSRTFLGCAVTNNYKVGLAADGNIPLEWMGQSPA